MHIAPQAPRQRSRLVLIVTALVVMLAGLAASGAIRSLSPGGFTDPATESARAETLLADRFHLSSSTLVIVVDTPGGVDLPETTARARQLHRELAADPGVASVVSAWSSPTSPGLRSTRGVQALIVVSLGGSEREVAATTDRLVHRYRESGQGLRLRLGGQAMADHEMTAQTEHDLVRAEAISFPLLMIALVFVFGSVVSAAIPLALGGITIVCVLGLLRLIATVTDVSVLATNVVTGLGLGLSIDYSLFVITRYREELAAGRPSEAALRRALRTAGRTVAYSAIVVAAALAALLPFPFYFLRSIALAGIPTALIAAAVALVPLPALLRVLGRRLDAGRVPGLAHRTPSSSGFWYRLAHWVMRRPVRVVLATLALLTVLALPALRMQLGLPDERVLPRDSSAARVGAILRADFPGGSARPTQVLLTAATELSGSSRARLAGQVDALASRFSQIEGVSGVSTLTGDYAGGRRLAAATAASERFVSGRSVLISVATRDSAYSATSRQVVQTIRATPTPIPMLVGGPSAQFDDAMATMRRAMPGALAILAFGSLVILFAFTGSVVLPLKAVVLNLLGLSAIFGVLVRGFQDGALAGLLGGFEVSGYLIWTVPIFLFCVAYGLSMDYEVFLLGRIREEYLTSGDNAESVALGLERVGRLVTAAAALVAIVFLSFATSGIVYLQAVGVGLALAVVLDATVIRALLVPAFMRLAGRVNWWAPAPLRRLHRRIGISD